MQNRKRTTVPDGPWGPMGPPDPPVKRRKRTREQRVPASRIVRAPPSSCASGGGCGTGRRSPSCGRWRGSTAVSRAATGSTGRTTGCPSRCRPGSRTGPTACASPTRAARSWRCRTGPGSRSPERRRLEARGSRRFHGAGLRAFVLPRPVKGGVCAHRDRAARARGRGRSWRRSTRGWRGSRAGSSGGSRSSRSSGTAHARVPGQPRRAGRVLRRGQRAG